MAEKDRLIPQVGPADRLLRSQLMSLRQGHQDSTAALLTAGCGRPRRQKSCPPGSGAMLHFPCGARGGLSEGLTYAHPTRKGFSIGPYRSCRCH